MNPLEFADPGYIVRPAQYTFYPDRVFPCPSPVGDMNYNFSYQVPSTPDMKRFKTCQDIQKQINEVNTNLKELCIIRNYFEDVLSKPPWFNCGRQYLIIENAILIHPCYKAQHYEQLINVTLRKLEMLDCLMEATAFVERHALNEVAYIELNTEVHIWGDMFFDSVVFVLKD